MKSIRIITFLAAAAVLAGVLAGVRASDAAFPGASGKMAFSAFTDVLSTDIFVMEPDGSGVARLTNDAEFDSDPVWSPDGSKIAFTKGLFAELRDVWVMNSDGSDQVRLTSNGDTPAWSPDGAKIAFARLSPGGAFPAHIWVMNADGTGQIQLTAGLASDGGPAWSPDGSKIAFVRFSAGEGGFGVGVDIWAMNTDGTGETNLTNTPAEFEFVLSWSPDGTKIAFDTRFQATGERQAIHRMNADGTGKTTLINLTIDPPRLPGEPAWSPDGTKIAFSVDAEPGGAFLDTDIWVMNADGTGPVDVTNTPGFNEFSPDWQPLPVISADIDVKPGGDPNSINLGNSGVIPVAILTTSAFDATTVDPTNICFGDAEAPAERDCSENHGTGHFEDVDHDGDSDLLLHYETGETGIDPGDTEACLSGETFGGQQMEGCDSVRVIR